MQKELIIKREKVVLALRLATTCERYASSVRNWQRVNEEHLVPLLETVDSFDSFNAKLLKDIQTLINTCEEISNEIQKK
jgi:hypothetical protein